MAQETLFLLHTNDIHSNLARWPKIKHYLIANQQKITAQQQNVLTFDIGDMIDRMHPYTEATLGKGNVSLMNEANYDAATIGNNEGMGLSHAALEDLYEQANFSVVLDNLQDSQTNLPPT